MNIGIFTNNYLPNPYGVTTSIESFRKEFERRGHSVFIFAPKYKGYTHANLNVICFPSVDVKYKISYPLPMQYSRKINKEIEKLDLDIIHSQHPALLGSAALKWARKKKIPLIFTWHTLYDQYAHFVPFIPEKLVSWWMISRAVKYANASDFVITPTPSIQGIIKKWGVKKKEISSIPTGVEEKLYANPDGKSIREKHGVGEDETLILLVSRLTAEKNIEFLFRSMFKALKTGDNVKFMVVGDGHLVPELKEKVMQNYLDNKIIFTGLIPRERVKNYYAAADIFVYASKSETQGTIITEAMYMGLPIVAVEATGSRDLVENNKNGFLVPEEKFAASVLRLVRDKKLREKFSQNSARIAREKYTDAVCGGKMLEIYNRAIKYFKQSHG